MHANARQGWVIRTFQIIRLYFVGPSDVLKIMSPQDSLILTKKVLYYAPFFAVLRNSGRHPTSHPSLHIVKLCAFVLNGLDWGGGRRVSWCQLVPPIPPPLGCQQARH